jgi:hypothetical protein
MAELLLDAARHTAILEAISVGAYLQDAARAARVHRYTLTRWIKQGEADREAGRLDTPQARLVADMDATEAACKIEILRSWKRKAVAATGDHTAARDLLARRWPAEFGPHDTRTVHTRGEIAVTHEHIPTAPDLGRMRALLQPPAGVDVLTVEAVDVPISSE